MKIGIIASNFIKMPPSPGFMPKGYAGAAETIIWQLTEKLVKRGHDVTIFCSGDTKTRAKKISVSRRATSLIKGIGPKKMIDFEYWLISKAISWAKKEKPDIICSHIPLRTAIFASSFNCPIVATLHSPPEYDQRYFDSKNQYYVAISNSQRKSLPNLNYIATIHHGLDTKIYEFSAKGGNKFCFIARIVPEKGLHIALKVAKQLNFKLNVFGEAPEESQEYWREKIMPLKDRNIFHGFCKRDKIQAVLRDSRALLFPIEVEEAFGLVAIESMACGTPVVAFKRGAMSEIIVNKKNGFLIEPKDYHGYTEAVKKIINLSENSYMEMRYFCRKHVEENFSIDKMVVEYEKVYQKIINQKRNSI